MRPGPVRPGDPRLGSLLTATSVADADVVIIGFPFDEGCVRNGGRAGAARGPAAFRSFFPFLGAVKNNELSADLSGLRIFDAGDASGSTLEEAHMHLRELVRGVLDENKRRCELGGAQQTSPYSFVIPIIVGGGNDQSLPNGLALLDVYGKDCGVINIDAHLDVRPKLDDGRIHSGYPFRGLLEDGRLEGRRFVEFACQGEQCGAAHCAYVQEEKCGHLFWLSHLRDELTAGDSAGVQVTLQQSGIRCPKEDKPVLLHFLQAMHLTGNNTFISFDIDAIGSAWCPGVSCPGTRGLSETDALNMCYLAGANEDVRLLDLSELNPEVEGYRSPRLVVFMVYSFLVGLTRRKRMHVKA